MKLAVSNIAWAPEQLESAMFEMARTGARGLEIAPGLAFQGEPDPYVPSPQAIREFRCRASAHGLSLVSMQSLLFGRPSARLFGTRDERAAFVDGVKAALTLASELDIPVAVLGSPSQRRVPDDMTDSDAHLAALDIIGAIGDEAARVGVYLALEPNPREYGTNFLTRFDETAAFVDALNHSHVRLNFDVGALKMTGEDIAAGALFSCHEPRIAHVHISEPMLAPPPADPAALRNLHRDMLRAGYCGWLSIEMRAPASGQLANLETALRACAAALAERADA